MKSRFVFSAFCMLVAMTMATGAFAQATFQASSGIEPRGRMNGHTELAGGITLFRSSGTITDGESGTVIIDYGVPITNTVGQTSDLEAIHVTICDQKVDDVAKASDPVVVVKDNTITVTVAETTKCIGDIDIDIDVSDVRLSLVGSGLDSVVATITASRDVRLLGGSNRLTVINTIVDPLGDDDVAADEATLIRHTGDPSGRDNMFELAITEPTVDAFMDGEINLEFSGIPDGAKVTVEAWVATKDIYDKDEVDNKALTVETKSSDGTIITTANLKNAQVSVNTPETMEGVVTGEDNKAIVLIGASKFFIGDDKKPATGGMLSPTDRDVVIVSGWIDFEDADAKKALLPLSLDIQVTADLGPIGVANPKGDDDDDIPRFDSNKTTAMTVINSTSDQTQLLVPYAVLLGEYDTGFSIANTTSGQSGSVTFSFPGDSTLDDFVSEMVGPGANLTVLLSEILGRGVNYSGQVMITTNFTDAEGVAFVSNWSTFTSASPLVKPNP